MPTIVVPTTLSAGEYTHIAGATDPRDNAKSLFVAPGMVPKVVVLDPKLTLTTPEKTWLASGVRAVDHSVGTFPSMHISGAMRATNFVGHIDRNRGFLLALRDGRIRENFRGSTGPHCPCTSQTQEGRLQRPSSKVGSSDRRSQVN